MLHSIDIAKKTFMTGRYDTNKKLQIINYPYTDAGIQLYIESLPQDSHIVMEHTGNYEQRLAHALINAGYKVSILPGSTIRNYAKTKGMGNKTDKQDVKVIMIYSEKHLEDLPIYKIPTDNISSAKQLRSLLEGLRKRLQATTNQRDAHLLIPNASKLVTQSYDRQIESIEEEITLVSTELDDLNMNQGNFNRDIPQSIDGVGKKTVDEIQSLLNTTTGLSIDNIPKFIKLTGLAPSSHESGSSVRGGRKISKGGYGSLRCTLYMASLGICTKSKKDSVFKDMYLRLRAKWPSQLSWVSY
jgi:transposase